MRLTAEQMEKLETPCVVIDVNQARRNIEDMQRAANALGCDLRPHVKTHKMPLFARMQVQAGAKGITCAKVSEAEVMADGGIEDIFIAYPMVGDFRVRRAIALHRRIRRLILAVDSSEGARALERAAAEANVVLEVRLEVDTGAKRTGVRQLAATALATEVAALSHLRLTGIYTFKGLTYQGEPTTDNGLAAREEGLLLSAMASDMRAAGVDIREISGGSTPTGLAVAGTGLVTEIRPGTYIFKDVMLTKEHAGSMEEIAARICATVVSCPSEDYAVIDGGTKTFPTDVPFHTLAGDYPGYAVVEGRDNLRLTRMNEEHGMLVCDGGPTRLRVGEKLALYPIHVCTALNMQNQVYLLENGELRTQTVEARGMLA